MLSESLEKVCKGVFLMVRSGIPSCTYAQMSGPSSITAKQQCFIHTKQKPGKLPVQPKQESNYINTAPHRSDRSAVKQNIQDGIMDTDGNTATTQLLLYSPQELIFYSLCRLIVVT